MPKLNSEQISLLKLLAELHSNKEIAEKLGITVKEVEASKQSLMTLLNLKGRIEISQYWEALKEKERT